MNTYTFAMGVLFSLLFLFGFATGVIVKSTIDIIKETRGGTL